MWFNTILIDVELSSREWGEWQKDIVRMGNGINVNQIQIFSVRYALKKCGKKIVIN